jgi:two-component system, sensor histidine kinase LadS
LFYIFSIGWILSYNFVIFTKFLLKGIYISFLVLFACLRLQGQGVIIFNKEIESKPIAGQFFIYEDYSGAKGISEILGASNIFRYNKEIIPHYAATKSAIWFKGNILVETEDPVYMQFSYPMIDSIELFIVNSANVVVAHKVAGAFIPIDKRELGSNFPKFRIKQGQYQYYIRVKGTYTIQLPIKLKSYQTLFQDRISENITQGAYMGFALLIILYTFFLWVSLRDKLYLYYILHIIATALITLHIGGYTFLLLWPQVPAINYYEPSILALSTFSTAFAIVFLETRTKLKKLHFWLVASVFINIVVVPLDIFGAHQFANFFVQVNLILSCLLMLAGGLISYKMGFKSARFFLVAWSVFLVGVIITTLQRVGILPYEYFFIHASQIGSAIDMVLLSLALADRINLLQYEKEKALEANVNNLRENRELVRQQNALLSLRVDERTKELNDQRQTLEQQKGQLEEMNKTKDKIFSVIAHDLRGPLANVSQLTDMMGEDSSLRNNETIAMLKDAAKQSFNLLDNLLLWAKAQYGDSEFAKGKVDLHKLVDNTKQLYYLKTRAKVIEIENNIPNNLFANADATMIDTVVRNLVSNALKFTLVGGKIEVGGNENKQTNTVCIWVKDSGLGISPDKLPAIFEAGKNKSVMGTDGETGTGLGLVICKDFVEKNNGTITVTSKQGQGTIFTVWLPAFSR